MGGSRNVRIWIQNRAPKDRVARYLTRIVNRMEVEFGFSIYPMCVSPLNNKVCDDLSRLEHDEARAHAQALGIHPVDIAQVFMRYVAERVRTPSLIRPTDPPGRAKAIMQHVEKRTVRAIPRNCMQNVVVVYMGTGVGYWARIHDGSPIGRNKGVYLPWPNETGYDQQWPKHGSVPSDRHVIMGTYPRDRDNQKYFWGCLQACFPEIVVLNSHPMAQRLESRLESHNVASWSWLVDAASLGAPLSCIRRITVGVTDQTPATPAIAPAYIFDVVLPEAIVDHLQSTDETDCMQGTLHITHLGPPEGTEPTQLGWIRMGPANIFLRLKVTTERNEDGVVAGRGGEPETWIAHTKSGASAHPASRLRARPTRYQVFSPKGASSPLGPPYPPSSYGHTLILDPNTARVRRLAAHECWAILGGLPEVARTYPSSSVISAVLGSSPYAIGIWSCQLACGLLATALQPEREGGTSPAPVNPDPHRLTDGEIALGNLLHQQCTHFLSKSHLSQRYRGDICRKFPAHAKVRVLTHVSPDIHFQIGTEPFSLRSKVEHSEMPQPPADEHRKVPSNPPLLFLFRPNFELKNGPRLTNHIKQRLDVATAIATNPPFKFASKAIRMSPRHCGCPNLVTLLKYPPLAEQISDVPLLPYQISRSEARKQPIKQRATTKLVRRATVKRCSQGGCTTLLEGINLRLQKYVTPSLRTVRVGFARCCEPPYSSRRPKTARPFLAKQLGHITLLGMPAPRGYRLKETSKDIARMLGHGPNKKRREALLNIRRKDGSVSFSELLARPALKWNSAKPEDLRNIAQAVTDDRELRLATVYDPIQKETRIRALNGHSIEIDAENDELRERITHPGLYIHGENMMTAPSILRNGLRAMARRDIHMADYVHARRQKEYLSDFARKKSGLL